MSVLTPGRSGALMLTFAKSSQPRPSATSTGLNALLRNASRQPEFTALVRGVTSEFRELGGEHTLHALELGEPSRFEDVLRRFIPPQNVLRESEAPAPMPIERADVGVIGGSGALRPAELAVALANRLIVDARESPTHEPGVVELPVLVTIGSQPVA